jgi:hypothetical protein
LIFLKGKNHMNLEILRPHSGEDVDVGLLGYNTTWTYR